MSGNCVVVMEVDEVDKSVQTNSPVDSLTSPPPPKKVKQATLPFKTFVSKSVAPPPAALNGGYPKKRKHSDSGPAQKTSRIQHSDDAENEVSSSSEADVAPRSMERVEKKKVTGPLNSFLYWTQQREVSTSGQDVMDLSADDEEPPVTSESLVASEPSITSELSVTSHPTVTSELAGPSEPSVTSGQSVTSELSATSEPLVTSDSSAIFEPSVTSEPMSLGIDDVTTPSKTNALCTSPRAPSVDQNGNFSSPKPNGVIRTPSSRKKFKTPSSSSKKREEEKERRRLEREKERLEKQKMREEKEKQRAAREQQKQEEKDRKERERQQKEKEKLEKMEIRDKEREEKNRIREEERKKKQMIIDARNEDRRIKEEEKKKKEDDLQRINEEKTKKKEKEQAIFKNFFAKPTKSSSSPKANEELIGKFMAFEVKKDMRMAPCHRADPEVVRSKVTEVDMLMQQQITETLYLDELKTRTLPLRSTQKTWPSRNDSCLETADDDSCLETVAADDDDVQIVDMDTAAAHVVVTPSRPPMRVKLLQFHQNYRPAYYGTWRKRSKLIAPTKPFNKDEDLLDYEVDSDEEWEEEEPGESLSHSEGEDGGEEDNDSEDDDGYFVPHGYLSEGEGCDDDENKSPETLKAEQTARARDWDKKMKLQCVAKTPVCIGCHWVSAHVPLDPAVEFLAKFQAVLLTSAPIDVTKPTPVVTAKSESEPAMPAKKKKTLLRPVPENAMADLVRLVHGNVSSIQKLIREFREYWRDTQTPPATQTPAQDDTQASKDAEASAGDASHGCYAFSKRQLDMSIRRIAVYEKRAATTFHRACWYVNADVLARYDLADLPVPTRWVWRTRPAVPAPPPPPVPVDPVPTAGTIRQFAVANLSPPVPPPPPPPAQQIKSPAMAAPPPKIKANPLLSRGTESSPIVLDTPKAPRAVSTPESSDDCRIVDSPASKKARRITPTIVSMFSGATQHKNVLKEHKQLAETGSKTTPITIDD